MENRLTFIKRLDERTKDGKILSLYQCSCGNFKKTTDYKVNHNMVKSCGCLVKDMAKTLASRRNSKTDNRSKTRLYRLWIEIKAFSDPNNKRYKHISLCDEWYIFDNFREWYNQNKIDGCVFHYDELHLCPENCRFLNKKESDKIKIKLSNLEKYGVEHTSSLQSTKDKVVATNLDRYGIEHTVFLEDCFKGRVEYFADEERKEKTYEKVRQTNLDRYGTEFPQSLEEIKQKIKNTCLEKYGGVSPAHSEEVRNKAIETNLKKYGAEYHMQTEEGKAAIKEGCIKSFGVDNYLKTEEGKRIVQQKRMESGFVYDINGKTLPTIAKELGISYGCALSRYNVFGDDFVNYDGKDTVIESIIREILENNNIEYLCRRKLGDYYPDFICGDLIIEANGLYWHSDIKKDKFYHYSKNAKYDNVGYRALFFYENEILSNKEWVESIILSFYKKQKPVRYEFETDKIKIYDKDDEQISVFNISGEDNIFINNRIDNYYILSELGFSKKSEYIGYIPFKNKKVSTDLDAEYKIWDCGQSIWGKINGS